MDLAARFGPVRPIGLAYNSRARHAGTLYGGVPILSLWSDDGLWSYARPAGPSAERCLRLHRHQNATAQVRAALFPSRDGRTQQFLLGMDVRGVDRGDRRAPNVASARGRGGLFAVRFSRPTSRQERSHCVQLPRSEDFWM